MSGVEVGPNLKNTYWEWASQTLKIENMDSVFFLKKNKF